MTNKVKPFFIRITDDMTPQMVQDAFDKCVDAGACAGDCVDEAKSEHEYQEPYEFGEYWLFGVADSGSTRFYDAEAWFGSDAQEITLDQLDKWLGLEVEEEWDGEGLAPVGVECEFKENSPSGASTFSDWSKCSILAYNEPNEASSELQIIIRDDRGDAAIIYSCDEPVFRKPETPEQKAERERLEAIGRLVNSSELPNGSSEKISAILTMIEDVYGSGALFAVVDLLEKISDESR